MVSAKERRRFSRFMILLTVKYQTLCLESGARQQGQGVLRDISLSGSFFYVDHNPAFQPGQLVSLSIVAPLLFLESDCMSRLSATGKVVRLEPPGFANPDYGVAVSFTENLSFSLPHLPDPAVFPMKEAHFSETGYDPHPIYLKPRTLDLLEINPI
jgi:hypothetical protein